MRSEDFISIRDLSPEETEFLLFQGRKIKAYPAAYRQALVGKTLALIFEKPSLRTRVSFDVGMHQLGGFCIHLSPSEIDLGRRETIHDVARNLERMVQGIVIRAFAHEAVEEMAACCDIPVINGLTDFSHPCQAMADYQTIYEVKGRVKNLKIAFVGDGNNVAHSLLFAGAQLGADVWIASPPGYEPKAEAVAWARERAMQTGGQVMITNEPREAAADADVVYTDVWTSMGQEAEAEERRRVFRPYQVNAELFSRAAPNAVFMHCLPARRGEEVTPEVIDSARSVVFQQAENRVHVQKAILIELLKQVPVGVMRPAETAEFALA